ncbi:MAG: peptidoglycan-binding domain-containing protein [Chthoniobacteraceae bacterium]|nr:peptidoglycan-binding domain-containing protein [Chthoniobacteraceae bacterium]
MPARTFPARTFPAATFPNRIGRFNQFGHINQFNRFDRFNRFNRFDRFDRFNRFNRFNQGVVFAGAGYPYFYGSPWGYPMGDPYAYNTPAMGYNPALSAVAAGPDMYPAAVGEGIGSCPVPVAGDVIGNVQRALKYRGFYQGPIDGLSGPATRAAVRAYDASVGLPPTGAIDARLLNSLGIM